MSKSYYECHVTMEFRPHVVGADRLTERENIEAAVLDVGWKFSAIDGDPVTGPGVKFYATKHFNVKLGDEKVLGLLHETAETLAGQQINVTRRKVERVLYDDRSSKVKPCNGGCVECHLDDAVAA